MQRAARDVFQGTRSAICAFHAANDMRQHALADLPWKRGLVSGPIPQGAAKPVNRIVGPELGHNLCRTMWLSRPSFFGEGNMQSDRLTAAIASIIRIAGGDRGTRCSLLVFIRSFGTVHRPLANRRAGQKRR